jgi:hypothetical protein
MVDIIQYIVMNETKDAKGYPLVAPAPMYM